jgi:hypothetical protein
MDEGEVGMPVRAPRRRRDRDEDDLGVRHAGGEVGREAEPAGLDVGSHEFLEPRLVDRDATGLQGLDLGDVVVDATHVVAEIGEAGAGNQTDIA